MPLNLVRKSATVGIDLGHHTIKAVLIERTSQGWKLNQVVSTPTPAGAIKDGVVIDTDAVAEALRTMLNEAKVHATSCNISVSGASVVVRTVRMPKMPEATLRKSIKFEAGRYVPSSVEDSFIEFEILGPVDDSTMEVLIVAAPRDIVESRVHACEAAGLEVEIVDIEPFATYRSLVEADSQTDWSNETFALVDIGAMTTNVSVINKGIFAMTRSIPQGGHTLTEALKNYFKLSDEDAESGKGQLDLRELLADGVPTENPPLRVLQPHIDDLIREIRRSLNYYQSQQSDGPLVVPVTKILLNGGGARFLGLSEYIESKMGIEAISLGVLDNPRFLASTPEPDSNGLELAVASGLAMRAFTKAA